VKINGLPNGTKAKITISGNGQTKSLDAAQKVSLGTGTYDVKAEVVTSADEIVRTVFKPGAPSQSVKVCNDTNVEVTYVAIESSGKLWMSNANGTALDLGYASSALGASSSPAATIAAQGKAGGGIAFDADGNLWGVAPTVSDPDVARIPAASLGTSGAKTSDRSVHIKGTGCSPANHSVAFDNKGNLWVSQPCEKRIVRLTPTDLVSSAAEIDPAVVIGGFDAPKGIAFDASGNLWVADGVVSRFNASRLGASTSDAPDGSLNINDESSPFSEYVAFDKNGDLWAVGGTVYNLARVAKADLTATGVTTPTAAVKISVDVGALPENVAFDESGGLWIATGAGKFARLSPTQLTVSTTDADPTIPERVFSSADVGSAGSMAFYPAPAGLPLFSAVP